MILDEQRRYVSVITDEIAKKGTNAESGQVDMSLSILKNQINTEESTTLCVLVLT